MKPSPIGIILGLIMLVTGIICFSISGEYFMDGNDEFMLAFGTAVFVNILGTLILSKEMEDVK